MDGWMDYGLAYTVLALSIRALFFCPLLHFKRLTSGTILFFYSSPVVEQTSTSIMNPEKLAKLQAQARTGSKGTPRRVIKKVHRAVAQDDRKLQLALEKLALTNMAYVEEVNMFKEDGTILHFRAPKGKDSLLSFSVPFFFFFVRIVLDRPFQLPMDNPTRG